MGTSRLPSGGPRRFRRTLLAAVALLATCVVVLLGSAGPASAHAYLEHSNPADGATVTSAPVRLELGFSEHVVLSATRITLTDGHGSSVDLDHLRLRTADLEDTEVPSVVEAALPRLDRGSYRVSWQTLSSDDLHRTSGLLVFGVRTHVEAGRTAEALPSPTESALTGLLLGGLAIGLGGPLACRVLRGMPPQEGRRVRSALGALAVGGAVVSALAPLGLAAEAVWSGGGGLRELLGGSYPLRWGARESGLVLLLLAAWRIRRAAAVRGTRLLLTSGAVLSGLGTAMLGHAAGGRHLDVLRVLATAAHLVAALTWAGAVVALAVALVALRVSPRLSVPPLRAALRGFAGPAVGCVAVMVVSGVYLAGASVVSLDAVVTTFYGRALMLKLALAAVVGALALVNHRRLRGRHDLRAPRGTVLAEAVAAVLVLLVTGVLVSGQPATQPQLVDRTLPTAGPLDRQVQDLQQSLDVRPNRAGAVQVLVDVFDTRRPAPAPVTDVSVRVGNGPVLDAAPLGDGHWSVPVPDLPAGNSVVTVSATREGMAPVAASYRWTAGAAVAPPHRVVSRAPIGGLLRATSGALAAVGAIGWALWWRRRGSRRNPAPGPGRAAGGPGSGEPCLVETLDGAGR